MATYWGTDLWPYESLGQKVGVLFTVKNGRVIQVTAGADDFQGWPSGVP